MTLVKKPKIIIIGGGFGGVFAAKELNKQAGKQFDIELISDRNYFVFQPLLPEVAAGTINAQDAVTPLRLMLKGIKIRLADVQDIDFEKNQVTILQGRKRILQNLDYDHLIIASGQITNLDLFPGFKHHSLTMKNLADAYHLRNHIIQCMELADVTKFADIKRRALTFVVAGGGFSGVETMGEMLEMVHRVRKYYPNIAKEDIQGVVIQLGDRLLQEMPAELANYAQQQLEKHGAKIMLNTGIESASATTVTTSTGEIIETMSIITTIGNGPSAFIQNLPLETVRGKILTNEFMQAKNHENVWSLGDVAAIPLTQVDSEQIAYAPPTAQFATREASHLAKNISACQQGKGMEAFHYEPVAMLASLGAYKGVAKIWGMRITGLPAWMFWRSVYIGILPHISTRIRVGLNWLFDYFMPRTIVQMAHNDSPAVKHVHYIKGEIVYDRGELIPGFFIVREGSFKLTIYKANGEVVEKILTQGDHGGDQAIEKDSLTLGKLEALDNSQLLFLKPDDFRALRSAIPALDEHMNSSADSDLKEVFKAHHS